MKKIVVLIELSLILGVGCVRAQVVSQEMARQIAETFFLSLSPTKTTSPIQVQTWGRSEHPSMYIYSSNNNWVVISGDQRVLPILAYSDDNGGAFPSENDMPEGMFEILEGYRLLIDSIRNENQAAKCMLWSSYTINTPPCITNGRNIVIGPLLSRDGHENIWGQYGNNDVGPIDSARMYNKFCPPARKLNSLDSCKNSVVGCGALAMAQIMWYWQWPHAAVVKDDYNHHLLRNYDWNAMPYQLLNSTDLTRADMIANLLHDVGVSISMSYGCGSSHYTSSISNGLEQIYGYYTSGDTLYRRLYSDSVWVEMIKAELNNQRPVLYSGNSDNAGHMFVIDGYNSSNQFHINYGWHGSGNGYFSLGQFEFYKYNVMIANIYPNYPLCTPLEINSTDVLDSIFVIQNGGSISIGDRTISAGMHGSIISGESVTLTSGFTVEAGAEVYIDVKEMYCDNPTNAFQAKRDEPINQDIKYADRWQIVANCHSTYGRPCWEEYNYYVVKDTIIDNYTYQLLNENQGCIRYSEDGTKFYYLTDGGEYLLCDFSLQVGDTCYAYIGKNPTGLNIVQPWIITDRKIIDERVHIYMTCDLPQGEVETEMIQGIGSHHFIFPMNPGILFIGAAYPFTLCAFNGDENIYSFDLTPHGIKNDCPNWEIIPKEDIATTPAEIPSASKILRDGHLLILRGDKTYTVTGQPCKTKK